eukprot:GHVO01052492.1.p1 GENE.GHVO01052492.1~~GHVO01052492.1.p1  ORF type:complete len:682 (-),score=156.58 GHVO01052492.1:30-2075(-)
MEATATFHELSEKGLIHPFFSRYTDSLGFSRTTPVQHACIPLLLSNADIAAEACTGSGKTLAFVVPTIEILIRKQTEKDGDEAHESRLTKIGAILLSPTRELANQIYKCVVGLLKVAEEDNSLGHGISALLLQGGKKGCGRDIAAIEACGGSKALRVLVATPGRLALLMKRSEPIWTFSTLEVLIFDEADRLLSMGFELQVSQILDGCPKQRRTGLFSATLTTSVSALVKGGLRNPKYVRIIPDNPTKREPDEPEPEQRLTHVTPSSLTNFYTICEQSHKLSVMCEMLCKYIAAEKDGRTEDLKIIVFFMTCSAVEFFWATLPRIMSQFAQKNKEPVKFSFHRFHGRMKQGSRQKCLKAFSEDASAPAPGARVLLTTDVAARGLDIDNVNLIVQFDAPQDPNYFVHRVGRTARAGRTGQSLLLLTETQLSFLDFMSGRNVVLEEREVDDGQSRPFNHADINKSLMDMQIKDRDIMERAKAAYVSHVRAYKEHQLSFVFPMESLDLGDLGSSLGLLRIPRVKEVLGKKLNFTPSTIDPSSIPYLDPAKEAQRQKELAEPKVAKPSSKEAPKKGEEDSRKKRTRTEKRVAKRTHSRCEWDDLAREETLAKKLRKGRLDIATYEKLVKGDLPSSESDDDGDDHVPKRTQKSIKCPKWAKRTTGHSKRKKKKKNKDKEESKKKNT